MVLEENYCLMKSPVQIRKRQNAWKVIRLEAISNDAANVTFKILKDADNQPIFNVVTTANVHHYEWARFSRIIRLIRIALIFTNTEVGHGVACCVV